MKITNIGGDGFGQGVSNRNATLAGGVPNCTALYAPEKITARKYW